MTIERIIRLSFHAAMIVLLSLCAVSFYLIYSLPPLTEITWLKWIQVTLLIGSSIGAFLVYRAVLHLVQRLRYEHAEIEKALKTIQESEERYRRVVELSPDAIWITRNNQLTYVNRAGRELIGVPKIEELIGQSPLEFMPKENHGLIRERFGSLLDTGETVTVLEEKIVRRDNTLRDVEMAATRIMDEGRPAIMLLLHDVTERKRIAEDLEAKEQRLRLAVEAGGMGTWDWDLTTNRIIWSEDYALLYGLEPHTFEDGYEPFLTHAHQEDMERVVDQLLRARSNRGTLYCEYRIHREDEIRWISIQGRVDTEEAPHMVGVVMDITERKNAEDQRQALVEQLHALTAHLQQVREEERTQIAREIHDELGQYLTGLKMEIVWCRSRLLKSPDQIPLSFILEKIESMGSMIDDTIRTVRRIASELRPGVLDELGLAAAIEWLAKDFEHRSGIRCQVDVQEVALEKNRSTAMFRVCQESLTNVARHAQATQVEISLKESSKAFILSIRDNGRGITDSQKIQTKSLGLLGMRERAGLVGGSLSIQGQPGEGTIVVMSLPI
jgi:PAS domain S-box-containing protein